MARKHEGKLIIYGIFNRRGKCLYVGQTISLDERFSNHRYGKFRGKKCVAKVIRRCSVETANRVEVQVIRAYKARGEARMNVASRAHGSRPGIRSQMATAFLRARVSPRRKNHYKRAAKAAGLSLAHWIFHHCDRAARRFLPKDL